MGGRGMHCFAPLSALVAIQWAEPVNAQQVKAGVLTCDVSEGMGYIIGSQKLLSCSFGPEGAGRREDYDGSITKFGLDLGLTRGGFLVWSVFTHTVAGPGFLAGDYVGASGEVTVAAGLGANVLVGGSNRTVALQPISLGGQTGLMSLLVLQRFGSGFRGSDEYLVALRASRSARSLAVFSRSACWAALYSASTSAP